MKLENKSEMINHEKAGYDAWVSFWVTYERAPSTGDCPARWMKFSPERSAYIKGWIKAKAEFSNNP